MNHHYREAQLPSNEVPHFDAIASRGEKIDERTGAIIARLPRDEIPCNGEVDSRGKHDQECKCLGTGTLTVHRPTIEPVDPIDDSLTALEDAIAARDSEVSHDAYLGAPIGEIMSRKVDAKGGGGSGGRKTPKPTRLASEPHPSATDGRHERTGRPPKYKGGARDSRLTSTVAPETANFVEAENSDIAALANELLAEPDVQALLAQIEAEKKA